MKKLLAAMLALMLVCFALSGAAFAEGKLTVTQKNLIEFTDDDAAYFFARIENTGDEPITAGTGKLVGFSADDEILVSEGYISICPDEIILQPGEYAYLYDYIWDSALEGADIADYKFSVSTGDYSVEAEKLDCEAELELGGDYDNYINVTFTNTQDETLYDAVVVVAALDAEGNLLFVDEESIGNLGIHPGSTVTYKTYIDYDVIQYLSEHALEITAVDAMVYSLQS